MMARITGPRPERRVNEPRGRREDDHRTVGRLESAWRLFVLPHLPKIALAVFTFAGGWVVAIYRLPEGHAQLAREVKADRLRADSFQSTVREFQKESSSDRASLRLGLDSATSEISDVKLGLCLQTPLDYRALMKCEPNLPPPRRP